LTVFSGSPEIAIVGNRRNGAEAVIPAKRETSYLLWIRRTELVAWQTEIYKVRVSSVHCLVRVYRETGQLYEAQAGLPVTTYLVGGEKEMYLWPLTDWKGVRMGFFSLLRPGGNDSMAV